MKKKKNFVKYCLCALFIDEAMEGSCSFESLVGTPCSFDRRDKHRSTEIVPLWLCNKDVTGHRSTWSFSGIESETDLVLQYSSQILKHLCDFPLPNVDLGFAVISVVQNTRGSTLGREKGHFSKKTCVRSKPRDFSRKFGRNGVCFNDL